MSKETKRQHFVPRTYLKNFGFKKSKSIQVWVCDKQNGERIFPSNIQNIALQNHFYTLEGSTIEERQQIEKFYSRHIEDDYNRVYEILTAHPWDRSLIRVMASCLPARSACGAGRFPSIPAESTASVILDESRFRTSQ